MENHYDEYFNSKLKACYNDSKKSIDEGLDLLNRIYTDDSIVPTLSTDEIIMDDETGHKKRERKQKTKKVLKNYF